MKIPFHFICAGLISILAATILPAHVIDPGLLKTLRDSGSKDYQGLRSGYWMEYEIDSAHNATLPDGDYDANGKKKDPGTVKDGNGILNQYDEHGKLMAAHVVIYGYVPDWDSQE